MTSPSIALVRQRYVYHGGAEVILARTITALQQQGTRVTLVTRAWQGVPGLVVHTCNPFYVGRLWRDWAFARCVCRTLAGQQFDLVQSHERIACCDVYRAGDGVHREWLAQRARVLGPAAHWLMRMNPYHRYMLRAEKNLFESPRLRAVICISRMVRDEIRNNFSIPAERLHIIYNGVDTAKFHPDLRGQRAAVRTQLDIPAPATLFLFVGSGFERKGVRQALMALSRLPDTAYLLVVGKDKHAGAFARLADRLGISKRVRFAGPRMDVLPFYGAADALLHPTLYEPFGTVVLEALAVGLPVITSHKCGGAELIEDGKNGFVCDALDCDGITAAMRRLLDPEQRNRMGVEARRTAEPLTLEAMGSQLTGLYLRLLNVAGT